MFGVPETTECTKRSYEFVAFPLGRATGKSLEVRFDFGPRPGLSKQLFGNSREGTELDWTYFNPGREIIYTFPLPPFLAQSIFQGRGVGVYILRPHAAGILSPPPLYRIGGEERMKSGPV